MPGKHTSMNVEASTSKRGFGYVPRRELHHVIGDAVRASFAAKGEVLMFTEKASWFYSDGVWEMNNGHLWLDVRIEVAVRGLGYTSDSKLIYETRNLLFRSLYHDDDEIAWDQHGKIPVRNGLIDPKTGELEPARPDHYCTWRLPIDYDATAECPNWERMVADVFGDRDAAERDALVGVVQECMGTALIDKKPRALSKGLVLWGGENRAKSGILEVVTGMFGGNPISSPLASIEGNHGTMPFVRRAPWVLHEAFNPGQWHFSAVVKAIITQDPIQINIKSGPMLTQVVHAPIFWATNHQPQFKEATKAIVSRMIVIEVTRQFDPDNPVGVAREAIKCGFSKPGEFIVATELPGVLKWALAGLRRALARGRIATTDGIDEAAKAIHRDSNLVAGFLDECVEFDPNARLRIADFNLAHSAWWLEMKGESRRMPSGEAVNKALSAAGEQRVAVHRMELRDNVCRYYCGVKLNDAGLRYHRAAYASKEFEGKRTGTPTEPGPNVNGFIPASWDDKDSIIAMRKAFDAMTEAQ